MFLKAHAAPLPLPFTVHRDPSVAGRCVYSKGLGAREKSHYGWVRPSDPGDRCAIFSQKSQNPPKHSRTIRQSSWVYGHDPIKINQVIGQMNLPFSRPSSQSLASQSGWLWHPLPPFNRDPSIYLAQKHFKKEDRAINTHPLTGLCLSLYLTL